MLTIDEAMVCRDRDIPALYFRKNIFGKSILI